MLQDTYLISLYNELFRIAKSETGLNRTHIRYLHGGKWCEDFTDVTKSVQPRLLPGSRGQRKDLQHYQTCCLFFYHVIANNERKINNHTTQKTSIMSWYDSHGKLFYATYVKAKRRENKVWNSLYFLKTNGTHFNLKAAANIYRQDHRKIQLTPSQSAPPERYATLET